MLQPRAHEAGGTYGTGTLVRKYLTGTAITIRVELTANHRGYFEFRLCPVNDNRVDATQVCHTSRNTLTIVYRISTFLVEENLLNVSVQSTLLIFFLRTINCLCNYKIKVLRFCYL